MSLLYLQLAEKHFVKKACCNNLDDVNTAFLSLSQELSFRRLVTVVDLRKIVIVLVMLKRTECK